MELKLLINMAFGGVSSYRSNWLREIKRSQLRSGESIRHSLVGISYDNRKFARGIFIVYINRKFVKGDFYCYINRKLAKGNFYCLY